MGSRLGGTTPKFLVPVLGRPMIDWLIELCRPYVDHVVLIVSPAAVALLDGKSWPRGLSVTVGTQAKPTGMLDAVLEAAPHVGAGDAERIWVLWCDQIALDPRTIATLGVRGAAADAAALIMPTCTRAQPYIHFDRDERGTITAVRQRREGDEMPSVGESDAGCFDLSRQAFLEDLPIYSASVPLGSSTGERNLLPFIPWLAGRRQVATFPCLHEVEAIGINTPDELRIVEQALAARQS